MKYKHSKEEIEKAVKKSFSTAQVCLLLNIKPAGGNYKTLKEKYKEFNIDISHFTGQSWNTGLRYKPFNIINKKDITDILSNKVIYVNSNRLKKRLINEGYKEQKCEICELSEWMGKAIPLELHHINGDKFDNSLSNLQILCSNCHGQTDNYCSKNCKTFIDKVKNKLILKTPNDDICYCNCGDIKDKRSKKCLKCYSLKQRKVERPSYDKLIKEIEELTYVGVGKKYNVSDNAIRKWIKQYKKDKQ